MPTPKPENKGQAGGQKRRAAFSLDQVLAAVRRDDETGICVLCGNEQSPVEPDARKYACESCGRRAVFGAPELMIRFPL